LGSYHRENGTTFSAIPFIPENFQWDEPKIHVPFTSQPEFPEFFGKWKTTKESDNFPTHSAELSNQTLYSK